MGILDGKAAVITGGGRGIGRGHSLVLSKEGAKVVICDVDVEEAQKVAAEVKKAGGTAVASGADIGTRKGSEELIQLCVKSFGKIDIMVNNAGILRDKSVANMEPEDFDAVLKVHLYGGFYCCRHALPVMREQKFGRIVNIVSSAGLRGNFGQANYGAAKAGLMGLTFVIAVEYMKGNAEGKYSITANALAPAGVTRMVGNIPGFDPSKAPPEMNPDLNGPIVAYIASEQAGHVNGQIFGRRGYAYTLFQTPKPIAAIYKEGGWTAGEIAKNFDAAFAEHLNVPGIPVTKAMADARAAAAKK